MTTWQTPWDLDASLTWRHFGGVDNDNPNDTLESEIPAIGYLDFTGSYQATDGILVRAGVLNLLGEGAPVFSGAGPALGNGNTYPTVYDTSRYMFASITAQF